MSDAGNSQTVPVPVHPPFPAARLLWSVGFAFVAWLVFWVILALALIQFVMTGVNGHVHEEIKRFSSSLIQYLWELLGFVTFVRDEQPFPVGAFPKAV